MTTRQYTAHKVYQIFTEGKIGVGITMKRLQKFELESNKHEVEMKGIKEEGRKCMGNVRKMMKSTKCTESKNFYKWKATGPDGISN